MTSEASAPGVTLDLRGSLSVVIGGSQGIGAGIAAGLARAGARLVLAGRDETRLRAVGVAAELSGGQSVEVRFVDVTEPESVDALAHDVLDGHGIPGVLVNAAGGMLRRAAFQVTVEEWDRVIDTHLRGTFLVSQAFGRSMAEVGYGKVINLSSTFATTITPGRAVYSVAKAGISQLTAALAVEWAEHGIRVNAIAPSTTWTPRVAERMNADPGLLDRRIRQVPLGRLARTEDVTNAALFLAAPQSDFITGQTLVVDGGWSITRSDTTTMTGPSKSEGGRNRDDHERTS